MILLCCDSILNPHRSELIDVVHIFSEKPVLVLDLEHKYGTTILAIVLDDYWCDCFEVASDGVHVVWGIGPHICFCVMKEPGGLASEIPLGADVGSRSEKYQHVVFDCEIKELWEVSGVGFEVEDSRLDFMMVPHHIHGETVQAHRLYHEDSVLPVLNRYAAVVNFPSVEFRRMRWLCLFH